MKRKYSLTNEIILTREQEYADRCYSRDAARAKIIKYLSNFYKYREMVKIWDNGKLRWYIEC